MQLFNQHSLISDKFYGLIDTVNTGLYWKNKEGVYLACNKYFLHIFGLKSRQDIIGKSDYDILSKEFADRIRQLDLLVLEKGGFKGEEAILINNVEHCLLLSKAKYIEEPNNVVGIAGSCIDITGQKKKMEAEKERAVSDEKDKIRQIIDGVNASIYWKDTEGYMVGCNKYVLDIFGVGAREEIIGRNENDLLSQEEAARINEIDRSVVQGETYYGEESVTTASGEKKVYLSTKKPLLSKNGSIIGIAGTSMDITAQKEAAQLKLENQAQKIAAEEQAKFREIVSQVNHDIRSPLASLSMITKKCANLLPERERNSIKNSTDRITDIANNMLNYFKPNRDANVENAEAEAEAKAKHTVLIAPEILEILTEKKYEYAQKSIDFIHEFTAEGSSAFIRVDTGSFKRMISNLINNAVDAFDDKLAEINGSISGVVGAILIKLHTEDNLVKITIQDDGKGMPPDVIHKVMNNIKITKGKSDGHGIGFSQIRNTLQVNNGTLKIESEVGVGTKIILIFQKEAAPDWFAEKIKLNSDDLIVILDDDHSIHGAWDCRLDLEAPRVKRKHFERGSDAVAFINALSVEREKIFLLTDFELLNEELNGLKVIETTGIKRSLLVTSHHANPNVLKTAALTNTKVLPKMLASEIPIYVSESNVRQTYSAREEVTDSYISDSNLQNMDHNINKNNPVENISLNLSDEGKIVDLVLIDDDQDFTKNLVRYMLKNRTVDVYHITTDFFSNLNKYPPNTRLFIDNQFKNEKITGLELAAHLHNLGFTRLFLLSGDDSRTIKIPDYLTSILKSDIDKIEELISKW